MEWIDYQDEDTGLEFRIPKFDTIDPEALRRKEERKVFDAIFNAMVQMKEKEVDSVPCFIIGELVFSMDRDSLIENSDTCLRYFETAEEFEICSRIVVLLQYLKSKP
jgi:hypothetical protein